jgi:hypothetical protein
VPFRFIPQHKRSTGEDGVEQQRGNGIACALPLLVEVRLADDGKVGVDVSKVVVKVVQRLILGWHHLGGDADGLVETGRWWQLHLELFLCRGLRERPSLVRDVGGWVY